MCMRMVTAVLLVCLAAGQVLAADDTTTMTAAADEGGRILVALDGATLTANDVKTMIQFGAGRDMKSAADMWIDIQLKAQAARQLGLDDDPETQFILKLVVDNFLATRVLDQYLREQAPTPTEDEIRAEYEANLEQYQVREQARVQHIAVMDREQANAIAEQARSGAAGFDALVEQYAPERDKQRQGYLAGPPSVLERQLGKEAAEGIFAAEAGAVLGPFVGSRGFEVVRVVEVQQARTRPLDEVRDDIKRMLQGKQFQAFQQSYLEDLKRKAQIERAAELAETKAAEPAAPTP